MARNRAAELLRRPEDPQRATFLELFFDLAFVVAFFQLSNVLAHDPTWSGGLQTLVLLLAVWFVWLITAGVTDRFAQTPVVQLLVIVTMLGSLVLSAALPEAFGRHGWLFAGVYIAIQVGRSLFLVFALRGHDVERIAVRGMFWSGIFAVPWIAGALAHGTARVALWTVAVAVEYTADTLRYPTPGLRRRRASSWTIAAEHLSERYRQFFIIALGELILVTGLALNGGNIAADRSAAFLVSFASTVLLWRIYIYRAGELLAAAIGASSDPTRIGRSASYAHLVMVAGIVVIAAGEELVVAHPSGHLRPAWIAIILGGPALFVAGRAGLEYSVFGRVSKDRLIGLLVLAALAPAMLLVRPLVAAATATAVLAGIAIADATRAWAHPREAPSPPGGPF
jgi:low temperature requirement protein LtrA